MARPQKAGLDYFPLDTDIDEDDKIALIEARHGIEGFGVIIKLFKKIYKHSGYYYEWNEETQLLFSRKIGVEINKVIDIVKDALKWKLFDEGVYKKYGVLTSNRIQKTYLKITYDRKEVEIIKEYILNGVNSMINRVNITINSINLTDSTQRKGKEIIKEIKEKNIYGDFVKLTEDDYQKLITQYGDKIIKQKIIELDDYLGQIGIKEADKKYKSHYHTIKNWIRLEGNKQKTKNNDWRKS